MDIKITDAEVVRLPVTKVEPPDGTLMLVPPPFGKCIHFNTTFEVDEDSGDCKCLGCGERVTAIFVLVQLMKQESRWNRTREAYQAEMQRLKERERTKCQHCGQITRISNR
jgi:hypothetical protein